MSRRRGFLIAVISAALFGFSTPLSKRLLDDGLGAFTLAGLLYLGAAVALSPWILHKRVVRRRSVLPPDRKNRLRLGGAILFGGVLGPVFVLLGLQRAEAASVSMWLNMETVATAVLAYLLFKEHIGRYTWLGNIAVLAASVLLGFESGNAGFLAAGLLALAGISWGFDNNFTALIDSISPIESTFWKGLVAGAVNVTIGLSFETATLSGDWLIALVIGAFSFGMSISLYIAAARIMGATRSQMVFASAPFFGVFLAVVWLGEPLGTWQWVAAGLLVAGLVAMAMDHHEHDHHHPAVTHEHAHRHDDDHHDHNHDDIEPGTLHSHEHDHAEQVHRHPHWPDLHHRHDH